MPASHCPNGLRHEKRSSSTPIGVDSRSAQLPPQNAHHANWLEEGAEEGADVARGGQVRGKRRIVPATDGLSSRGEALESELRP